MKILSTIDCCEKNIVLTIGNFDGVHLGHQKLFELMFSLGKEKELSTAVLTFSPHPKEILKDTIDFYLNDFDEKEVLLNEIGIDYLWTMNFNTLLASMTASEFLDKYIISNPKIKMVILGHDFGLGVDKKGTKEFLKKYLSDHFIDCEISPPFLFENEIVSSSLIRTALKDGLIKKANNLLKRPFFISGMVVEGKKLGREMKFPTINLSVNKKRIIPKKGVYITQVLIKDKWLGAVTNIGFNPTVSNKNEIKIETHILNFSENLYGAQIQLRFLKRLRDELTFNNVEELRAQIAKDVLGAEEFFGIH